MKITKQVLGIAQTNTYYIDLGEGVIVVDPCLDPGYNDLNLLKPLKGKNVLAVLITHGHFDHISGIDSIVKNHNCPVYMYHEEVHWLKNPSKNLSLQFGEPISIEASVTPIKLQPFKIGQLNIEVIKTPGHTAGSISYVIDNHIFDGDFIMNMGVGRTDLPTGNMASLEKAMKAFAEELGDKNMILYPGHGDVTFLDDEIKYNPYLRKL